MQKLCNTSLKYDMSG